MQTVFLSVNGQVAAQNGQRGFRLDAVLSGGDGDGTVFYGDSTQ